MTSDGHPPVPPKGQKKPELPALSPWQWFYERTELTDADADMLWKKRGLLRATCEAFGLRSSLRRYKDVLLEMKDHFPMALLLDMGLWKQGDKPQDPPVPNPMYYGWGIAGKVLVEEEDDGKPQSNGHAKKKTEVKWDWTHPILIPYRDSAGTLVFIRPHKGNPRGAIPRLFIARPQAELGTNIGKPLVGPHEYDFAIITEGEFKAAALWQALNGNAGIAALPGITMAKPLFGDIEDWLSETLEGRRRQVIVGYDNEEKGDPNLPESFKAEKWKRYESAVWSRYLALALTQEGYEGKVCTLPKEWRNEKGKADWDGALAFLISEQTKRAPNKEKLSPEAQWSVVHELVRLELLKVLNSSARTADMAQLGLFDPEEERCIRRRLERISYVPNLPIGGDDEVMIARRLQRLAFKLRGDGERMAKNLRGFLVYLAKQYQDVQGGYYTLRPLTEKQMPAWLEAQENAGEDVEVKRACEIALKGVPMRVSDFYLKVHYVLKRLDGTRQRLVTIHNMWGANTGLVALPSSYFSQPARWREWLMDNSPGAAWCAGERELQKLHMDVNRVVSFKDVEEVTIRGYHEASKLYFFEDVAYSPDGEELFPDEHGIFWHARPDEKITRGYKLSDKDQEGQKFSQGLPRMQPKREITPEKLKEMFKEVAQNMFETLGDYSGWMALGMILACGAAPEIYSTYCQFPGFWVHGQQSQGKSSVMRWLIRIWGFDVQKGMSLMGSTSAGVSIAMQQYGNLPMWLEEYQPGAPEWVITKLQNFFGREHVGKKTFDEMTRSVLAVPAVSGIATCHESQVRSRYTHVQVSANRRKTNHYQWFQENSTDFFFIGRHILKNRREYADLVMNALRSWMQSSSMQSMDERARFVHGTAFAGFYALAAMLETHSPNELDQFHAFVRAGGEEAMRQTEQGVNVNKFWRDVVTAIKSDAFGVTPAERCEIFKVMPDPSMSPISEHQLKVGTDSPSYMWKSLLLYFQPDPVIEKLRAHKRKQGADVPLNRNDLHSQMKVKPYWVSYKHGIHKQRFGRGKTNESCWCIRLDAHELGYQEVTDAEFDASLRDADTGDWVRREEWADPRCGDLFALIESLKSQKEPGEKPNV